MEPIVKIPETEITKEIFTTLAEYGLTELPYYACHKIGEGKVRCIENRHIESYAGYTIKDLVYFLYCLKEELRKGFIVRFNWNHDGIRKEVVMLPNAGYVGCFDTKGTWMHIQYNADSKEFCAYCNIKWGRGIDEERTKRDMTDVEIQLLCAK